MKADLVIDTSGRMAKLSKWLNVCWTDLTTDRGMKCVTWLQQKKKCSTPLNLAIAFARLLIWCGKALNKKKKQHCPFDVRTRLERLEAYHQMLSFLTESRDIS